MRFDFIGQVRHEPPHWNLTLLCRVLEVSCSGYAAWRKRQRQSPTPRQQAQARLVLQIRAAHRRGRCYYGSPTVHRDLREQGIGVSRKRVARLMRQQGLRGRCRRRRAVHTTDSQHASRHALPLAPNLLARRFAPQEVGRVNRFWCGDITYVPTVEGWQYLATVQDLFSRRVLGWAMSDRLEADVVERAWQRALLTRGFSEEQGPIFTIATGVANMANMPVTFFNQLWRVPGRCAV